MRWAAAVLNLIPFPIGLGYVLLGRWGRAIVSFFLRVVLGSVFSVMAAAGRPCDRLGTLGRARCGERTRLGRGIVRRGWPKRDVRGARVGGHIRGHCGGRLARRREEGWARTMSRTGAAPGSRGCRWSAPHRRPVHPVGDRRPWGIRSGSAGGSIDFPSDSAPERRYQ